MVTPVQAVRGYLTALREPESLRDEDAIDEKSEELAGAEDVIERLRIHEELKALKTPSVDEAEEAFVVHAKAWADEAGISADAFMAENVDAAVLRRAGFSTARSGKKGSRRSSGKRVRTEEVVQSIPSTAFTVKRLGEISGASAAVVRKAISQEQEAGKLTELGPDPDHSGPGRAPTLYKKG